MNCAYMPSGAANRARKEARQDRVLALLRSGKTRAEAAKIEGLGGNTYDTWRKDPAFKHRMDHALDVGKAVREGTATGIPDFLTFRENHIAYSERKTKRVIRARNSFYQIDAERKLQEELFLLMVLHPGAIKTSLFSIEKNVHSIMFNRDFRGLVVQQSQPEATKIVAAVQERLDHPYYHMMAERMAEQGDEPITCPLCVYNLDPFKPESRSSGGKWGAEGFRVEGRTSGEKDDTFQAKGAGSQILGIRSDRITLDDVQSPLSALRSPKDGDDLIEWLNSTILSRVFDDQQVVILGNFFSDTDFMHKVIETHPEFRVVQYPAILDWDKKTVLCPDVWTFDGLMKKRASVGERAWHYTWMQAEGSLDSSTFRREALEAAKTDDRLGEKPAAVTHVVMGCDPATAASGFCAIVVWGLDVRTKQRYLIDVFNKKGMLTHDNVTAQLLEMARLYEPRKLVIEGNAQQKALMHHDALQRGMRSLGVKLEVYQTVTGTGARSEQTNFDITTIGGLFEAGLVSLPYGGPLDERERVDAYIDQLCAWRTDDQGHSIKYLTRDMVMATLFSESETFLIAKKGVEDKPARKPRVPRFATNGKGGWAWRKPVEHERPRLKTVAP